MSYRFVTLEGIDGCGKSTQARLLADWLRERVGEEKVVSTFEPGGGNKAIRDIVLGGGLSPKAELLLFLADRLEHADKIIRPALADGKFVVCDRYLDSTYVYQSMRGISRYELEGLFSWCHFPAPTITLFFDIPVEVAAERLLARGKPADNFESGGLDYMRKLSARYSDILSMHRRFVRIDASRSVNEIADEVRKIATNRLEF